MNRLHPTGGGVLNGIIWSFAQTWGGRALTFVLFLILARLLTPTEFGLASAVATLVLLIGVVAELGFGDAIVQRRDLEPADVALPFFVSMVISILLSLAVALASGSIERLIGLPGLAPLIVMACVFTPVVTLSAFQEAQYKRHLDFKTLAVRLLVATMASGVIGIGAAFLGAGAASLVLQWGTLTTVGAIWLWSRPRWWPSIDFRIGSFLSLASYGIFVFSNRLADFVIGRIIDLLILTLHGAAALGLYTVGARVYQTAMQLFTGALSDISLSAVSRIAGDIDQTRAAYLRSISVATIVVSPFFVAGAALAPDLSALLFGARWIGSESAMRPLLLLGAVQCVQFMNGPFFGALGRPGIVLALNGVKFAAVTIALTVGSNRNIGEMTTAFALAQVAVTPLTFGWIAAMLRIPTVTLLRILAGPALACAAAYAAAICTQSFLQGIEMERLLLMCIAFGIFVISYTCFVLIFSRNQLFWIISIIRRSRND